MRYPKSAFEQDKLYFSTKDWDSSFNEEIIKLAFLYFIKMQDKTTYSPFICLELAWAYADGLNTNYKVK